MCAALGQLDYFATLALQQHGQQSALRKGRRHNFLFSLSKRWTIFKGIPFIPCGRVANRPKILNKKQGDKSRPAAARINSLQIGQNVMSEEMPPRAA
jgi:hypothetical protein